jgi:hypothetical protein
MATHGRMQANSISTGADLQASALPDCAEHIHQQVKAVRILTQFFTIYSSGIQILLFAQLQMPFPFSSEPLKLFAYSSSYTHRILYIQQKLNELHLL